MAELQGFDDALAPDVLALDARFGPLATATQRLSALPLDGLLTYLVDATPAAFLPELGQQLHIMPMEGWQFARSADECRALIRASIGLHKKKGTPWALRRMLAVAGFGATSAITEGGMQQRYDGTVFADGSDLFAGAAWASFRVDVDLGDNAALDAATPAMVRSLVDAWRPVGRHLSRLAWHVDGLDVATSAEAAQTGAQLQASSQRPNRPLFDGALHYDQGRLLLYDGTLAASGAAAYLGYSASPAQWLAGAPESDTTLAVAWADASRVQRLALADGLTRANGLADYGATAPLAVDAPMPMTLVRQVRFNGRYAYGGDNLFDGAAHFDGARRYVAGQQASGNQSFYLEAA